jgi:hypothetical protein
MDPASEEHAPLTGAGIRDFAQMHVDLARTEVREGSARFVWGLLLLSGSILVGSLALLIGCAALYLALRSVVGPAPAAALTSVGLLGVSALLVHIGFRCLGGLRSLLLPRTRQMLGELFRWQDDRNGS